MSNKLVWNEEKTNEDRLRQVYNWINWLMYEMQDGTVPNMNIPISIAFVKLAEKGEIDEITASEHMEMFLPWDAKSTFEIGSLRTRAFENGTKLYQCLQAHTGQAGWEPEKVPALWKELVIAKDGIPVWSQPISVMDAYMKDSEVWHKEQIWVSDYDNNVWEPGMFGWHIKEVAE